MKVLWVEDNDRVCELLSIAATKAVRHRLQIDVVIAMSLIEAEARLRLERFDLVVLDLGLPDSFDADMTIARLANMGAPRLAVVSGSRNRAGSLKPQPRAVATTSHTATTTISSDRAWRIRRALSGCSTIRRSALPANTTMSAWTSVAMPT